MNTVSVEHYLKLADSKSLDVLLWLLRNRCEGNLIHTTLDKLADQCSVTKVTVNRVFQRLYKEGYLTKIRNGQYQLHNL